MGKKSKRHAAQGAAPKPAAGSMINNRAVCRVVEEIWTKTQGPAPTSVANLWKEYDELTELVEALKEKQGPTACPLPSREEGLSKLYRWLSANKAEFDKVEVAEFEGVGYGLKAKTDVLENERVILVPETLMMTSETAKASQLGPLIARDRMLQVMPNVALALHLLNEHYNPRSFWRPYIDVLPTSFTLPLCFNKAKLELLQGSPCLADALQHARSVAKLYAHLHKLLRAHGDTSFFVYSVGFYFEDFVWAVCCVMSRQNEIPLKDGNGSALALIPLWDMCNHWLGTITTDFNPDTRCCECYSPSVVKEGKELRIFYGARSNAELFLHQGFVYPPNTGDSLRIKMGLSTAEEPTTKAMKSKLLKQLQIPLSGVFHLLASEEPFPPQMRGFVRIFTATTEELERYSAMDGETLKKAVMSDTWVKADVKALDFIAKRCELLLKSYRSSVFEDFERVHKTKLDDQSHQAIMLTICERCILGSAVKVATTCKTALEQGKDPELLGFAGRKKKREAEARLAERKRREEEEARKLEGATRTSQPDVEDKSGELIENGLEAADVEGKQEEEEGEGEEGEEERERERREEEEDGQTATTDQENHEQDQPTPSVTTTVTQNGEEGEGEGDRGQAEERHEEEENGEKEDGEEEEDGEKEDGEEEKDLSSSVATTVTQNGGEGEGEGEGEGITEDRGQAEERHEEEEKENGEEEKDSSSLATAPPENPATEETESTGNG